MGVELQCYVHGSGHRWEAICVDLDISVQGGSPKEVRSSLDSAIGMYLNRVAELPSGERRAFLRRRSPLYLRLKLAALEWLCRMRRSDVQPRGFVLRPSVPAHP